MIVFILHHIHRFDDGTEDGKLIGLYSSEAAATAAKERVRLQPGFCDTPDGFVVYAYQVDEDHWTDGFAIDDSDACEEL